MLCSIEALLTPADFAGLRQRDLSKSACVVFDVLRATSTIVTALANGAAAVIPVAEISEALEIRRHRRDVLLGGERNGLRIGADLTGGVEFDLGNSPREYTPERVAGKIIISTTTNGTRALRACAGARRVVVASFLNLKAAADFVVREKPEHLLLVCAGTGEGVALEDVLAAGDLCERVISGLSSCVICDSAEIARQAYRQSMGNLPAAVQSSQNARRLLANPALRDDVEFCLRRDCWDLIPLLGQDGVIKKNV